jgi:hypothetical protein
MFPLLYFRSILITGIALGLVNGAAIRWRVSTD